MRAILCFFLPVLFLFPDAAYPADFQPTLLKITADELVDYDFDGRELRLPVTIEGAPAGVVFCIFTKDKADRIDYTVNGYLGWHQVNKVDTCMYYSPLYDFDIGENVITWDGRDQDGNWVNAGSYTYYLWGYDNKSDKQPVSYHLNSDIYYDSCCEIQEVDMNDLPLSRPVWYQNVWNSNIGRNILSKWDIGSDPQDSLALQSSTIELDENWYTRYDPQMQPDDSDYFYLFVANGNEQKGSIQKVRFIENGTAEIQQAWGENAPYASFFYGETNYTAGVATDGSYLITSNASRNERITNIHIYDYDGYLVETADLSDWWCLEEELPYSELCGVITNFSARSGYISMQSSLNCLVQMISPIRFLETGETGDLYVWTNGNGDNVLDKPFHENSRTVWNCNQNSEPYKFGIAIDSNMFSVSSSSDNINGPSVFGLFAPDGTGIGQFRYAVDMSGPRNGITIIDSGTPFDGMYRDLNEAITYNKIASGVRFEYNGIGYLAQDSFKGVLTSMADCFNTTPYVSIVQPSTGDTIFKGRKSLIRLAFCSIPPIKVEYSIDGGETWRFIGEMTQQYSPNFTWDVPDIETDNCYIRASRTQEPFLTETAGPFSIVADDVSVETSAPLSCALAQNSPNPFNPVTTIPFILAKESDITLTVYNIAGEKVATLAEGQFPAGRHSADWNASRFASGIYFYRLQAGDFVETRKMTVIK